MWVGVRGTREGEGERGVCGWLVWEDFKHRVTLTKWEDSQWWRCSGAIAVMGSWWNGTPIIYLGYV